MADLKAQLEIGADVSGVEAGISKAKKSINSLGVAVQDANSRGAKSIDRYVQSLQTQAATLGKSTRESELYKLALKGASDQQLRAADSALKMAERYERTEAMAQRLRSAVIGFGAVAATGLIAASVAFDQLLKKAGDFQDMAEKYGDTAENFASLAVSAGTAGVQMDTVGAATARLTKGLTGVDDESKEVGAAIKALGLDLVDFKNKAPTDQLEAVAKALASFEDGASKTAVAMALFGKSGAELLPFLRELATEGGRQVILTEQQIKLADEYADKQARLAAQISLHAQAIAVELLPTINELTKVMADLAQDQQIAAVASDVLKGALNGAVVIFQTIAVVASDVGFVFQGVGREIGAIAAQLAALARLDFAGFRAISEAVREDGERARAELDKFQARIMAIGQPQTRDPDADREAARFARQAQQASQPLRSLRFSGAADKGDKSKADQEAKARLAADIAAIKAASDQITSIYGNAQKIMEAQRAAGLLDEQEYYQAKAAFLRLNSDEQERALAAEISRLQRERSALSGRDRVENERKVADLRAQIVKVQQAASAAQIVLDTQEAAAARQRAAAIESARQAAHDYYDEQERQRARELAGIGQGNRSRNLNAGISQIEDRYAAQRRDLENQRALLEMEGKFTQEARVQYAERLRIINDFQQKSIDSYVGYYSQLMEQQGNWAAGANEALRNYFDESQDVFKGTEQLVTSAFQGMEDALVEFVKTGKLDFKSLVDSIIADLARIVIRQNITGPLANAISGALSGALGGGSAFDFASSGSMDSFLGFAKGGVFNTDGLSAHSNTVVHKPTLFAFARGAGLMGEAGPEAIMPLRRGPDGRLGVEAGSSGGGSTVVHQNIMVGDFVNKASMRQEMATTLRAAQVKQQRTRTYAGGDD